MTFDKIEMVREDICRKLRPRLTWDDYENFPFDH